MELAGMPLEHQDQNGLYLQMTVDTAYFQLGSLSPGNVSRVGNLRPEGWRNLPRPTTPRTGNMLCKITLY